MTKAILYSLYFPVLLLIGSINNESSLNSIDSEIEISCEFEETLDEARRCRIGLNYNQIGCGCCDDDDPEVVFLATGISSCHIASISWNFGPFACTEDLTDPFAPIVCFDASAIFDATGQHGSQFVAVTVCVDDFFGNTTCSVRTIRIVPC